MEPNENLKRQRELVEELLEEPFGGDAKDLVQAGLELARLVKELDESKAAPAESVQIEVFARWYGYPSTFCQASTPDYRYVVAIPRLTYNMPELFKRELYDHAHEGDPYFVFEYSDQFLSVANTFEIPKSQESWRQCYLTVRPDGGLMFKNESWSD